MASHRISEKERMQRLYFGAFFQKSINVTPTRVKMAEHAKNEEALIHANVPQSFKEGTVH